MSMDYTGLESFVRSRLPEKRYNHSLGVVEMSRELAKRFSLSVTDASCIGIYHDAYRYDCDESTASCCRAHGIEVFPEEEKDPMLLHGALAAVHFDEDAGGVPSFWKTAVRHHTLGHAAMGRYGAVVYIADYAERGRKHLGDAERHRILSCPTLEEMVIMIMDMQRPYFESKGIKEAAVSVELYCFLKDGGRFA